ncbi:hypothetical protein [Glutamicibacter sp. NPDC127525]|uniref:hypothetical protein n=1 Tax=unclassified Glutamicibacter TaxID=2627139 RepID=UPI003627852D
MSTPIVDLNDPQGGYWQLPPNNEAFKPSFPPPGIRYYKMTGRHRINGEWLVVHTGERGFTTYRYIEPMTIKRINYPEEE